MADNGLKLKNEWFNRSYEDFSETGGFSYTFDNTIPRPSSRRRQQQSRASEGPPSLARVVEGVVTKGPIPGYSEYAGQEFDRALNAPPPAWLTSDPRAADALGQDAANAMAGRVYQMLMDVARSMDSALGTSRPTRPTPPPAGSGYYP